MDVSDREQFCHQLDFFDLQTAKKLQLIDSAACRLQFKLAEMNLIDTFLYTEHCSVPPGERFQESVPWLKKGWEALF